jgi:DNA-binding response OmpR family regulator
MRRVLVVEDNADVRHLLDLLLRMAGYIGRIAEAADEARRALTLGAYDLVLLDVRLPDGDGLEFCREVRASHPHVPVIVVSGDVRPHARDQALAAGAAHFVAKPFDPETLERVVRLTLGDAPDRRRTPRAPRP